MRPTSQLPPNDPIIARPSATMGHVYHQLTHRHPLTSNSLRRGGSSRGEVLLPNRSATDRLSSAGTALRQTYRSGAVPDTGTPRSPVCGVGVVP